MKDLTSRCFQVLLNKVEIGSLSLLDDDRTLFVFNQSYVEDEARPTLSISFKTPLGEVRTEEKMRNNGILPPFFSNLLPEGQLRDYLARQFRINPRKEFVLLGALREDLPGAIRLLEPTITPRAEDLNEPGRSSYRFSLAGVQMKLSAEIDNTGHFSIPPSGIGTWILKTPALAFTGVPEAEYSMLSLAQKSGLSVPEFRLIRTSAINGLPTDLVSVIDRDNDSLIVKRFDRGENGSHIHMEDFAQVFGVYPNQKYETASFDRIGYVILSEAGEVDFIEYIQRLVFSVLTGNGDMHLKNWSLVYKDTVSPRLSPAYDLIPTILFLPNDDLGLRLGGTRSFSNITESNFRKFAAKTRASESLVLRTVHETMERVSEAWKNLQGTLPLSKQQKDAVAFHMTKMQSQLRTARPQPRGNHGNSAI